MFFCAWLVSCPLVQAGQWAVQRTMAEPDPETISSGAGQRLGAPETLGISTLDPGHRPPAMPPGRHVTIRVRMLDDTEELFDISVSYYRFSRCGTGLFIVTQQPRSISRFHLQSGNRLAWKLHVEWNWRDLSNIRVIPVYCGLFNFCSLFPNLPNGFRSALRLSLLLHHNCTR